MPLLTYITKQVGDVGEVGKQWVINNLHSSTQKQGVEEVEED